MRKQNWGIVYSTRFRGWNRSLAPLLEAAGLREMLAGVRRILIKPNLVRISPPPVTTPVALAAALVDWLKTVTKARILIGDGTGSLEYDTSQVFAKLGYTELAAGKNAGLIDLNEADTVRKTNPALRRFPEIHLPEIAFDSFLISLPVLKAHTLAGVTLAMKNMIGLAPPAHYHQQGFWKKAAFHDRIQAAIADLNRYRAPDFTILDATVGLSASHLGGPCCEPPVNRLAAGRDPVAVDAYGAKLLGRDWRRIGHIRMVHQELGAADPLEIVEVSTGLRGETSHHR